MSSYKDNYYLTEKLKQLGLSEDNIYNFIIRKSISPLVEHLLEQIINNDNISIENIILNSFFTADQMKPISFNKSTLSKLTGLSERQIDERRRDRYFDYIDLSENYNDKVTHIKNEIKKLENKLIHLNAKHDSQ